MRLGPGVAPRRRGRSYFLAGRMYYRKRSRQYQTRDDSRKRCRVIHQGKMTCSKRGSQEAKAKISEETETKRKTRVVACKVHRSRQPTLVNYRSSKRDSPRLTKAKSRIRGMVGFLLDGANDVRSLTESPRESNDTMVLLLSSGKEETVRDSTLNKKKSPCTTCYTTGSR